ncbi:MAG: hypothetical protein IPP59_05615 [Betaproteobacteria bacterium]|nr:hypothetical protein [Candidatus Dechloromonas phosphorivorans]
MAKTEYTPEETRYIEKYNGTVESPGCKQNHILSRLPAPDYAPLPDLHLVDLPLQWTMSESGDHIIFALSHLRHCLTVYTLEDGSSKRNGIGWQRKLVGISIFMGGESSRGITEVQSAGKPIDSVAK